MYLMLYLYHGKTVWANPVVTCKRGNVQENLWFRKMVKRINSMNVEQCMNLCNPEMNTDSKFLHLYEVYITTIQRNAYGKWYRFRFILKSQDYVHFYESLNTEHHHTFFFFFVQSCWHVNRMRFRDFNGINLSTEFTKRIFFK